MPPQRQTYLPIELGSISSASMLEFDLYQESGGFYRLFRRANVALRPDDITTLIERGCKTLFVPQDQSDQLHEHQTKQLSSLLLDKSIPVDRKCEVLTDISMNLYDRFLATPVPPGSVKQAVNQCEHHVELSLQGDTARQSLLSQKPQSVSPSAHAVGVCNLSILLAVEHEISDPQSLQAIGIGGLMHEVGKTLIDPYYFSRPEMKHHIANSRLGKYPEVGAEMLAEEDTVPDIALRSVLEHRERLDGSGFPHNLKGKDICEAARIVAICDAYEEAMTKGGKLSHPSAFDVLSRMKDSIAQYDVPLFRSFIRMLGTEVARATTMN